MNDKENSFTGILKKKCAHSNLIFFHTAGMGFLPLNPLGGRLKGWRTTHDKFFSCPLH
jgi:hypothetical protein